MMRTAMKSGERYGRLVSINHVEGLGQFWKFRCDCGREHVARAKDVRSGNTKSCGCLMLELSHRQNRRTHGMSDSPEYISWGSMLNRCYNENCEDYPRYGGRGIVVCEDWRNSFEVFFKDMGLRPSSKYSIDRYPNNDGNYEPTNCRWATVKEQANNRHNTRFVEVDGRKLPLKDAALALGMKYQTLFWRVNNGRDIGSNARVI